MGSTPVMTQDTDRTGRATPIKEPSSDLTPIFSDGPVREGPVAFGFEGFANTLADLALGRANQTPFTVVVKGESGYGKTTLLETIRRRLEERGTRATAALAGHREVKTLWLNTWKFPQGDMILAGLLGTLLDRFRTGALAEQLTVFMEQRKHLLPLAAAASWLPGQPAGGAALAASRFDNSARKRAFYHHFEELFHELAYAWFHGSFRAADGQTRQTHAAGSRDPVIAVFLDDLDRCPTDRITETLEAIALFLDRPGVCCYLGLDWHHVKDALDDATGGRHARLLEKIVQVEFDLPEVAEESAHDYLRRLVSGTPLARVLDDDGQRLAAEILRRRDPRHIKRFLNHLSMQVGMLRHAHRLEPPGSDQHARLDEADLLSWHLVREALPVDQCTNLTKHRLNLDGFLNRYEAAVDAWDRSATPPTLNEAEARIFRHPAMRPHLERLLVLSPRLRGLLMHLDAPPQDETPVVAVARPTVDAVDGQWWVHVRSGSFAMGAADGETDEQPVHPVQVSEFEMSRYPVTNADYHVYVDEIGAPAPRHWTDRQIPGGKETHPVVHVSWHDAEAFCVWLSTKLGREVRLPTEAQWEYAARGGDGWQYPWGDEDPTDKHAHFGGGSDTMPADAHPLGATLEGISDLAGNTWEWCRDRYGPYEDGAHTDPTGPRSGRGRVLRGGAFIYNPKHLRSAARFYSEPDNSDGDIGFLCVTDAGGQTERP